MKQLLFLLACSFFVCTLPAQDTRKGKVVVNRFLAPSLQGNRAGEDPLRRVTVYLPPGYEMSNQRYPTIYYLHGFLVDDSLMMHWNRMNELMDVAISACHLHPMILVLPDSDDNFGGSFYTNSSLTGNWADYIGKDVVAFIDKKYRTIPNRDSRGLTGHSMGGNGALKLAMLYPEVFGAVYALSPAVLGWSEDFTLNSPAFRGIDSFRNELSGQQIVSGLMKGDTAAQQYFQRKLMADLARTYSPNNEKTFLSAAMPVRYVGDSMVVNGDGKEVASQLSAQHDRKSLARVEKFTCLKARLGPE
jgi:S-formylglutathione hydrolase FrmB